MFSRNILVWFVHTLLISLSICQLGRTIWEKCLTMPLGLITNQPLLGQHRGTALSDRQIQDISPWSSLWFSYPEQNTFLSCPEKGRVAPY